MTDMESQKPDERAVASLEDKQCGLVMPISATSEHSDSHWKDVLKLVHRAIENAGFEPRNVWESSATDRISERIVGNLFNLPIVIVDISDLNPNVMFELGLRLSSKKPTIVICNEGGSIPFDIRDFEAIFYPSDLNILGMEEFFKKLERQIADKYRRFSSETYQPFLSNVIVDVASPQTREVELNDLILSRLDDLSRKVSAIEATRSPSIRRHVRDPVPLEAGSLYIELPEDSVEQFTRDAGALYDVDEIKRLHSYDGKMTLELEVSSGSLRDSERKIVTLAEQFGGSEGMPF